MIELIEKLTNAIEDFSDRIKDFFLWIYLFFLYCLVWPGCPRIGDPRKANVIWGFAFGRNSYSDEKDIAILKKSYSDERELFHRLDLNDFDPGNPNFGIARGVKAKMSKMLIPAVLQWEIVTALYKLFPDWFFHNQSRIFCIWPEGYMTSKELILKFVEIKKDQIPIIVSDKRHSVRAVLLVWRFFRKPIVGDLTASFDPFSVQDWIRNWKKWLKREILVRCHHIIFRRIL